MLEGFTPLRPNLVTGGRNHRSFGEKNFNCPGRAVVLRPGPVQR